MTALTELTLESGVKAAWKEWLESYFDGGAHDVGATTGQVFPRATIVFGQGRIAQPLAAADHPQGAADVNAEIRVLTLPRMGEATWNGDAVGEHLLATEAVLFQFQVRARAARGEQADLRAQTVAELLRALLRNPTCTLALAQAGVTHLEPQLPLTVADPDYPLRLLNCRAQLQYPVRP